MNTLIINNNNINFEKNALSINSIGVLPGEILVKIISSLDEKSFLNFRMCSKTIYELAMTYLDSYVEDVFSCTKYEPSSDVSKRPIALYGMMFTWFTLNHSNSPVELIKKLRIETSFQKDSLSEDSLIGMYSRLIQSKTPFDEERSWVKKIKNATLSMNTNELNNVIEEFKKSILSRLKDPQKQETVMKLFQKLDPNSIQYLQPRRKIIKKVYPHKAPYKYKDYLDRLFNVLISQGINKSQLLRFANSEIGVRTNAHDKVADSIIEESNDVATIENLLNQYYPQEITNKEWLADQNRRNWLAALIRQSSRLVGQGCIDQAIELVSHLPSTELETSGKADRRNVRLIGVDKLCKQLLECRNLSAKHLNDLESFVQNTPAVITSDEVLKVNIKLKITTIMQNCSIEEAVLTNSN